MTVFQLPVGVSGYKADPSDIHVATIPQCATTRRHRVPIRISRAHSGSFSKKLKGRARPSDRLVFKPIFNKNHVLPLKTESYVDDGAHDVFPSRGRDEKNLRKTSKRNELSGWGVTQPRSHLSIGTGFPIVVIGFGGLLVRVITRATPIVVLGRLFPVVIAAGLRSVRHAYTPRREMRHTQTFCCTNGSK